MLSILSHYKLLYQLHCLNGRARYMALNLDKLTTDINTLIAAVAALQGSAQQIADLQAQLAQAKADLADAQLRIDGLDTTVVNALPK